MKRATLWDSYGEKVDPHISRFETACLSKRPAVHHTAEQYGEPQKRRGRTGRIDSPEMFIYVGLIQVISHCLFKDFHADSQDLFVQVEIGRVQGIINSFTRIGTTKAHDGTGALLHI